KATSRVFLRRRSVLIQGRRRREMAGRSRRRGTLRIRFAVTGLLIAAAVAFGPPARAASPSVCAELGKHSFADIPDAPTSILSAAVVQATESLPAYCRVRAIVVPHVGFELRLPLDRWNGRFFMQGCHGYCGEIEIEDADDALARGFSTAAT